MEHPPNRWARRMALHHSKKVIVGRGLQLALENVLNAADSASTRGTVENGLGISRTELDVGDDVGFAESGGEALKEARRVNRLVS